MTFDIYGREFCLDGPPFIVTSTIGNPAKVPLLWQPDAPNMHMLQMAAMVIPVTVERVIQGADLISASSYWVCFHYVTVSPAYVFFLRSWAD